MPESSLHLVQRLIAEGKSTEEIRVALQSRDAKLGPQASSLHIEPQKTAAQGANISAQPYRTPAPTAAAPIAKAYPEILPAFPAPSSLVAGFGWPFIIAVCLIPAIAMTIDSSFATRFGTFSNTLLT